MLNLFLHFTVIVLNFGKVEVFTGGASEGVYDVRARRLEMRGRIVRLRNEDLEEDKLTFSVSLVTNSAFNEFHILCKAEGVPGRNFLNCREKGYFPEQCIVLFVQLTWLSSPRYLGL